MSSRTLVIDTATAACSVALLDGSGVVDARHEPVGRGHAERLIPMIAELPEGGRAGHILVDVGPGSFTGIRVGIAAARGLALGWGATVSGYSALALLARQWFDDRPGERTVAVVTEGGHGEVFMQGFADDPLLATDALASLSPADALARIGARVAIGSGLRFLPDLPVAQAGGVLLPDASRAGGLPDGLRQLSPRPLYGRAPDAKLPA